MKAGIHPNYREVLFVDMSNDFKFITRSTINTRETGEFEGKTYPLAKIEVSSESHPFYTGQQKIMDTAGRVHDLLVTGVERMRFRRHFDLC